MISGCKQYLTHQASVSLAFSLCFSGLTCIAYDRKISIDEDLNESPVRLVEPTPLSEAATMACSEKLAVEENVGCPMPEHSRLPHFLDKDKKLYQFCSCESDNEVDSNALQFFRLYAEDQDPEEDEELRAVLLLDLEFDPSKPINIADHVNYTNYVDPSNVLDPSFDKHSFYNLSAIGRPSPGLRSITIGNDEEKIDLCNGNDHPDPLAPGWHTLTVLVTDRPWFQNGPITQYGVPDIANGATFDSLHYTFYCLSRDNEEEAELCKCIPVDSPN